MSRTRMIGLVLCYIACGAAGDLMLSYGMKNMQNPAVAYPWLWAILGTTSLAGGYGILLGLLKDVPLSVVVPAGAGSYVIIAALSKMVLNESVPALRWAGTLLVSVGVAMVMLSDLRTRSSTPPVEERLEPAIQREEEAELRLPALVGSQETGDRRQESAVSGQRSAIWSQSGPV